MSRKDKIAIKKTKDTWELIAFILNAPANPGMVLSYMRVGQHSEASKLFMKECLPVDYSVLKNKAPCALSLLVNELKNIGYNVELVQ